MDSPIIEVRDLWFSFNGQPILKEVNLTVHPGDFLAVIGPNGGGKTTLIKLMLGLLEPDRGTIRVLGNTPREAAPRIGYVPQGIAVNNSFPISVLDVALMGRMRGGKGWWRFSGADRMIAQKALERVEMWEFRTHRMEELSGGQRQRVFMARALVAEPEMLFLDEATASVDTKGQSDFYEFLRELNETVTIVVVSHDLSIVSSYVKSVACVNQQLIFHDAAEITGEMLEMAYHCPVELIAHGLPHRVLQVHKD
ncbi:MAG: metal ABC transporter ATP-binding protein [Deltaproteobacteria bacterium]|nr:metal ABC transporter ATP-binding protein [Deltaproteobacteria bacterium]